MKKSFFYMFVFLPLAFSCVLAGARTFPIMNDNRIPEVGAASLSADEDFLEAAMGGSVYDLQQALNKGADLHAVDGDGDGALHLAAYFNDSLRVFEFLLSKGLDPNTANKDGEAPLHIAVRGKRPLAVIQILIDNKANVNLRDDNGATPFLTSSVYSGDIQVPLVLLEAGADPHAVDVDGDGALHLAVWFNDSPLPMLSFLLSKGLDPNTVNKEGKTPLHIAVLNKKPFTVIQFLADNKANVNLRDEYGATPFLYSAVSLDARVPALLLEAGADLHTVDEQGDGILHHFFISNNESLEFFMFFLEKGANVQAINNKGWSALHIAAAFSEYPEFVSVLVKRGLDVNLSGSDGITPLHAAVFFENNPEVIGALLDLGGDIYAVDGIGQSVLDLANKIDDNPDIVNLILRHKDQLIRDL